MSRQKEKREPAELTIDSAQDALRHLSCVTPDGGLICPLCRIGDLTLTRNGNGPQAECSAGCDGVESYLQGVASQSTPKGPDIDQVALLRTKLRLDELVRVAKHGRMGTNYVLHLLDGREVDIGNIVALTTQSKFRAAFLPQVGHNPPRYKPGEWDDVAELIEQVADEIETSSDAEETRGWVLAATSGQLLRNVDLGDSAQVFDLLGQRDPPAFVSVAGDLHIRLPTLQTWLSRQAGVRIAATELSGRLSTVGLRPTQISARGGAPSIVRKARYWACPHQTLL